MKVIKLAIILFFAFSTTTFAHTGGECSHNHKNTRNEIGVSAGPLFCLAHEEWGVGAHLHIFRTLRPQSNWSVGIGAGHSWTGGGHFKVGAGVKYKFFNNFSLSVLPGLTFLTHDHAHDHHHGHNHGTCDGETHSNTLFSVHFELVYDLFHWNNFHLGPAIDFSLARNHSHFMIGIHAAYGF